MNQTSRSELRRTVRKEIGFTTNIGRYFLLCVLAVCVSLIPETVFAQSNPFSPVSLWTAGFNDDQGWKTDPAYWETIRFPDVNGDGKHDVCGRGVNGITCAVTDGATFASATLWSTTFSDDQGWHTDPAYWQTIRFPDVTGDGLADVCGRGVAGVWCAISNGSAFTGPVIWTSHFSDDQGWNEDAAYWQTIRFPDLDGDGAADICGRGVAGIWCARSDGAEFLTPTLWTSYFSDDQGWDTDPAYWETVHFPDVSGDGSADVCGRGVAGIWCGTSNATEFSVPVLWTGLFRDEQGWNTDPAYWATIEFADIDRNGNADVCGRGVNGISCAISNGSSFIRSALWSEHFSDDQGWNTDPAYWETIRYPSLGPDSRADVCGRGVAGIWCTTSNGIAFIDPQLYTSAFSDSQGWNNDPAYWKTIQFPDLNGDGAADVCGRGVSGVFCALRVIHRIYLPLVL